MPVQQKGKTAGTTDRGLRMEAFVIDTSTVPGLQIDAKVQIQGDSTPRTYTNINGGTILGTTDQSKAMYSVQLSSNKVEGKELRYSVYIAGVGWTKWAADGEQLGEPSKQQRIEAIRIRYVAPGILK